MTMILGEQRVQAWNAMAKLGVPREQVERVLGERIRVDEEIAAKVKVRRKIGDT